MIEQILSARNLSIARNKVIANKGSSGVDGMEVSELKDFIQSERSTVCTSIIHRSYKKSPIRGVEIPKGNGKTRLLGVPTVVERWLQQAVSQQLANRFELDFEEESYGFRPKKNAQQAVLKSQDYINNGYQDIVDIDLKGFFDEVPHHKLLQLIYNKVKCPTTLWLIRKWLRAPLLIKGKLHKRRKGIPQGSPLSPLLSNIILDQLDKYLKHKGYKFIRYADDFSVYTTSKSKARVIGNGIYMFLRDKLELPINRNKSGIRRPNTFKILGHGFVPTYKKGAKGQYQIVVDKKSWQSLKRKLRQITKKTKPMRLAERLAELKLIYRGWLNNFRLGNLEGKLKKLDEWLRNRLRYCIWADWKKPERKRKNLIRLGIEQGQAYAWSRTRMGGWAVAQSPILKTTITVKRLQLRGYEQMLYYYHKVKF
ncbi:group II intron reverse transcriptase/maturase [Psychroflexus sediminis]|uniref:RNA-directed DNA polymerase n=1 Tax=Psychroflexus sediminis TaxID=470826 RepID=A0A1G7ZJF2_9FLAO|nr:group II intron reverse transcriptase/maturase [Psychroflexus sediminis]SDH08843.1 group II intron reverse transcriptase/maturase [Psychroflexus sediminis]